MASAMFIELISQPENAEVFVFDADKINYDVDCRTNSLNCCRLILLECDQKMEFFS